MQAESFNVLWNTLLNPPHLDVQCESVEFIHLCRGILGNVKSYMKNYPTDYF